MPPVVFDQYTAVELFMALSLNHWLLDVRHILTAKKLGIDFPCFLSLVASRSLPDICLGGGFVNHYESKKLYNRSTCFPWLLLEERDCKDS